MARSSVSPSRPTTAASQPSATWAGRRQGATRTTLWCSGSSRDPPSAPRKVVAIYFNSLEDQLEQVRRWNHSRRWGFREADFAAVDLSHRDHPSPLIVDVVAVYLPATHKMDGVRRTCHELWQLVARDHPASFAWDDGKDWVKPVRLLDGIEHRPGIRRVTLDLAAHWHRVRAVRPLRVRGTDSAAAEILAAAAHFPFWVRSMDGHQVPYVWLSGYQLTIPENETWRHLPCLSWNQLENRVSLAAHWADLSQTFWASPVLVG